MSEPDDETSPEYERNSEDMVAKEQEFLRSDAWARVGAGETRPWSGIALSGGGIRSSTFCLGVLQALAARDLIKNFDYISSVSGGGYIACALQWWWQQDSKCSSGPSDFPYGTQDPKKLEQGTPNPKLNFLRRNSDYLAPGHGLTFWSGTAVVLRTIFLNLIVWMPILAVTHVALLLAGEGINRILWRHADRWWGFTLWMMTTAKWPVMYALMFLVACAGIAGLAGLSLLFSLASRVEDQRRQKIELFVSLIILGGLISFLNLFAVLVRKDPSLTGNLLKVLKDAWLLVVPLPVLVIAFAFAIMAAFKIVPRNKITPSYYFRRKLEIFGGWVAIPVLYLAIFSSVPLAYNLAGGDVTPGGLLGLVSGIGAALYGHYSTLRNWNAGIAHFVVVTVGSAAFLYGVFFLCYGMGVSWAYSPSRSDVLEFLIGMLLFISVASLYAVNINHIGLHRYYRDRLMECFLPSDDAIGDQTIDSSPAADAFSVSDIRPDKSRAGHIPFPIINTNLILFRDSNPVRCSRGGASFAITPLYTGSEATGWIKTKDYEEGQGSVSLATAMAVSGAAANSNAGYTGTGLTRNRLVALLMRLTNVRLGVWLSNPRRRQKFTVPKHIHPGLTYGLLGFGHTANAAPRSRARRPGCDALGRAPTARSPAG